MHRSYSKRVTAAVILLLLCSLGEAVGDRDYYRRYRSHVVGDRKITRHRRTYLRSLDEWSGAADAWVGLSQKEVARD